MRKSYQYPPEAMAAIINGRSAEVDPVRAAEVRWAVSRMEPQLRAVAIARWLDGHSRREIQERMGLTRWEVWKLERQARVFLQSELAVA